MKAPSTPQLISWLMDRDAELRVQACLGLAERRIHTTGALLLSALTDADAGVREAAALACGRVKGPGARRGLEACAADPDPAVATAARLALVALDEDPDGDGAQPAPPTPLELLPALLEQVRDPDPLVRANGLLRLGRCPDAMAGPPLVAALEDPSPGVRARAAAGLVSHPMGRAAERLLELLDDDESEVRCNSARALGALRAGEAYPALSIALGDDFQSVRAAAASALARIGGDRVRRELHNAARTWVPGSVPVLEALLDLDENVDGELTAWLEHPFEGVRGVAVDWVLARRLRHFASRLEPLLDDPEPWLQVEAQEALHRLNGQRS